MIKILIDPGHAPGNSNKGKNGYYEYAGMWKVANYLKNELEKYNDVKVDLTRARNQDLSLEDRGKKSLGCDLFISEHSNAAATQEANGVEVWYSVQNKSDYEFGIALSTEISSLMKNKKRGANTRLYPNSLSTDYYGVIRSAAVAKCSHIFIVENGFHTNLKDEAFLLNDNNLAEIARVQANVIGRFLKLEKKKIKTVNEALDVLIDEKIISTKEYWLNAISVVNYLDKLLINVANKL